MGEIVEHTFKDKEGNYGIDEVILFCNCPHIVDVVTSTELERGGKDDDDVCKPRFASWQNVKPLSPRRYFMRKEELIALINEVFNLTSVSEVSVNEN